MVLAAASYAVMPIRVSPTLAAFTDPVAVSGTQLTAALPAPANPACVKGNGQRVTLSWAVVTGVTYRVYDDGVATAPTTAGTYTTANRDVGQLWVVATRTFSGAAVDLGRLHPLHVRPRRVPSRLRRSPRLPPCLPPPSVSSPSRATSASTCGC